MNQCPSCGGFKIRGHKCPTTTITIKSMSKEEMVEWWKNLKSKNGYQIMSRKDKRFLEEIISRELNSK